MKNNQSKDPLKYLITEMKGILLMGKTKTSEWSLCLCQEEAWAVSEAADGQQWLVFGLCFGVACPVPSSVSDNPSVVGSLSGCRFLL